MKNNFKIERNIKHKMHNAMNHSHVYIHIQQHTTIIHNHTISSHKTQPNIIQTNIVCYIFHIHMHISLDSDTDPNWQHI